MLRAGHAAAGLLAALALCCIAFAQGEPEGQPQAETAPETETPAAEALPPPAPLPEPRELEIIDIPNDGGNQIGALWYWDGAAGDQISVALEIQATTELLKPFELSESERNRLRSAREQLAAALAPLLPDRDRLQTERAEAQQRIVDLESAPPGQLDRQALREARANYWRIAGELRAVQHKVDRARDAFAAQVTSTRGNLAERARQHDWLAQAINGADFLPTNGRLQPGETAATKGEFPSYFGTEPDAPDKLIMVADAITVRNPAPIAEAHDEYDEPPVGRVEIPLEPGRLYVARLAVTDGTTLRHFGEAPVEPAASLFKGTIANNFVMAWAFALIILAAVFLARKNPNLFIRRIAGLEAVDEAIGRATEMGKPVMYLPGMNDLTDLATLAAINILGRVARKVAEYDSDLLVPLRDPVVMTVAQEVVRSGYTDMGRPDAFKEGNIFFVTQDQFSYTATTCGIMLREKPAANFFMGYYYAESLLLAETGQSTGAIQIAGTDSQNQLPFFITTCDYTLIGEELYAASAYLSREPLLLGSLKGLDVAKAVIILAIVLQVVLFIIGGPELDFVRNIFRAL